ncbi:MAG: sigma-70 region 4 domain-containing protein [bacterium]|nr:sigma-70 region 4 domain-containing protein [bacterium]
MAADLEPADELARLLATLIRFQAPSQSDAILELKKSGLGQKRIAELLGTTPNTVNVTISRAKKKGREDGEG